MKTVVILGNARSGTSMTAGLLSFIGVNINHIHKPNSQNPKGAFESIGFNTITSKMQTDLQSGMSKPEIKAKYEKDIINLIGTCKSEYWGWKSAATHWNLDIFWPHLDDPHLVIVTRNITHNAQSWVVHMKDNYGENVTFEHALHVMANSTQQLVSAAKSVKCPKLWTTYEDIKKHPWQEAKKMCDFLGIKKGEKVRKEIENFIMPEYSTINE